MDVITDPKGFLAKIFDVAVAASVPALVLPEFMPEPPKGKTILLGAGKASAQMAAAFEAHCAKDSAWTSPLSGLIVTQYGAGVPCEYIEIVEASHPVPDEAGLVAAQRMMALAKNAGPDDLVVALISGGGSSLLPLPMIGLNLADKQELNRILLASGAPISAMNAIRKMFSLIKGGRLGATVSPARLVSLVLSDVPGDDPAMVASGPTIADMSDTRGATNFITQYEIELPQNLRTLLAQGNNPSPKPTDACFIKASHNIIASAKLSLDAAAHVARKAGCEVIVLSDAIEGEASIVGREQGQLIHEHVARRPLQKPLLILSGGETTVTIKRGMPKSGKGGRNSEYLLALAIEIAGLENVYCLGADTDGRDGSEDNAGAFCDGTSISRLSKMGLNGEGFLTSHDSWTAFSQLEDLLVSGPTGTNVNDFRALLIS